MPAPSTRNIVPLLPTAAADIPAVPVAQARRRSRFQSPRRARRAEPVLSQQQAPPDTSGPPLILSAGRRRLMAARHGRRFDVPPTAAQAQAPTVWAPTFQPERRRLVAVRAGARFEPPFETGRPLPPPGRNRRPAGRPRRGRRFEQIADQGAVQPGRARRKLRPWFVRRGNTAEPPWVALVPPPPSERPVDRIGRRRLLVWLVRRGQAVEPPWPQQATPSAPTFVPPIRRIRSLLGLVRRARRPEPPFGFAVPVAPARPPDRTSRRTRLVALRRAARIVLPPGQDTRPTTTRRRTVTPARRPRGTRLVLPPPQAAPVLTALVARIRSPRRAAGLLRRLRTWRFPWSSPGPEPPVLTAPLAATRLDGYARGERVDDDGGGERLDGHGRGARLDRDGEAVRLDGYGGADD